MSQNHREIDRPNTVDQQHGGGQETGKAADTVQPKKKCRLETD